MGSEEAWREEVIAELREIRELLKAISLEMVKVRQVLEETLSEWPFQGSETQEFPPVG
ncbi:MAG: hypothetical protein QN189_10945 [Armatimonadota bacterium]|nr:hypothetical protein [Armatimonadota bacterium]